MQQLLHYSDSLSVIFHPLLKLLLWDKSFWITFFSIKLTPLLFSSTALHFYFNAKTSTNFFPIHSTSKNNIARLQKRQKNCKRKTYVLMVHPNLKLCFPPVSEASREVANLTERKNPHPLRIWCQRICLSVCL